MKTIIRYENSGVDYPLVKSSLDDFFNSLKYWWLELDKAGVPIRELGFNDADQVQYAAPRSADYGLWSDSALRFENPEEYAIIQDIDFQMKWDDF